MIKVKTIIRQKDLFYLFKDQKKKLKKKIFEKLENFEKI